MKNKKIWCLVYKPDGSLFEFYIGKKNTGMECLIDICRILKIVEIFYFGLKFTDHRNNMKWINLRNLLKDELPLIPPVRLFLMVKYFVNPQAVIQRATEDFFFHSLMFKLQSGDLDLNLEKRELALKLVALYVFIEIKSYDIVPQTNQKEIFDMFYEKLTDTFIWDSSSINECFDLFLKLPFHMTEGEAKILFLQYGSRLTLYGSECFPISYYHIRSRQSFFKYGRFVLYVCTDKLSVRLYEREENTRPSKTLLEIMYSDISTASFKGEYVTVYYHSTENNNDKKLAIVFKFGKMEDTLSMFKIFTEFHTFFHCRSVKNVIYYRELLLAKDTFLIRWFFKIYKKKRETDTNIRYMFDVHCTRRQAYEYVYNFLNDPNIYTKENNKSSLSIKYINERYRIHLIPMGLVPENICKKQASLLCKQEPLHLNPNEFEENDPNIKILKSKIKNKSLEYILNKQKEGPIPSIAYKFNDYFEHIINPKSDNLKEYTWEQLEKAIIYKKNILMDLKENEKEKNPTLATEGYEHLKGYCIMCLDKDINCVFCPCGHSVACLNCSEKCRRCPVCRGPIHLVQRVYFLA